MNKVLIGATNFSQYCKNAKDYLLAQGYEIDENETGRPLTQEELAGRVGDICGALVGCEEWTEDIFQKAPRLKVLARFGIGVDNIDLEAAKRHGVKVCNAKGINSDSVAEQTVGAILALYRGFRQLDRTTRQGQWDRYMGHNIRGKTVGLVGFGAIAQYTAKLLKAFEPAKIYAYDVYHDDAKAAQLGVTFAELDTIIKEADIITLHVPLMDATHHLFGAAQFAAMKPNALLVNVARGPVVDEKALYAALKAGQLAGAALDVFEQEPSSAGNPLFTLDNVLVTPHTAAETYDVYDAVSRFGAEMVVQVMAGGDPRNWLNP